MNKYQVTVTVPIIVTVEIKAEDESEALFLLKDEMELKESGSSIFTTNDNCYLSLPLDINLEKANVTKSN